MMNLRRSASYFHPGKTPDANRVGQPFDEKMLESMGLVTSDGFLTQAGILFSDNCNAYNSKLVGTRWAGLTKTDAINDHEYQGNLLLLLRAGVDFVNSNTNSGWMKLPDGRKNLPDYAERATLEAIVNRDYTVIGGEVHIDIFDDRIGFNSPGGMFNGTLIQNRDIPRSRQSEGILYSQMYSPTWNIWKKRLRAAEDL